jgi:hypothetical protein
MRSKSDKKIAHKCFKYYKATGKFPHDVGELRCWLLMHNFGYHIATDENATTIQKLLTLIQDVSAGLGACAGEFSRVGLIDVLKMRNPLFERQVSVNYINLSRKNWREKTQAFRTRMIDHSEPIFFCDCAEAINAKSMQWLLDLALSTSRMLLLGYKGNKYHECVTKYVQVHQIGKKSKKRGIRFYARHLINNPNRLAVERIFENFKLSKYFFEFLAINATRHYKGENLAKFLAVVTKAESLTFRARSTNIATFLVHAIPRTSVVRKFIYPNKGGKVSATHAKNGNLLQM